MINWQIFGISDTGSPAPIVYTNFTENTASLFCFPDRATKTGFTPRLPIRFLH